MKKTLALGMLVGVMCFGTIGAGAMTKSPTGYLRTGNPIWSAPYGVASTVCNHKSYGTAYAKVTVAKNGYNTKTTSVSACETNVETNQLSGPTWSSEGTRFSSTHSGYTYQGKKWTDAHSAMY